MFPTVLKIARVIPVFKQKGSSDDQTNYRPISLLPIFAKILESLMKDQITNYMENNNLFTQDQFGFRNRRSTTLAIDRLTEFVSRGWEDGLDTYASFFDLTKAFDCVSFDILLQKLQYYNFHPNSIAFVESYLRDRQQYVSYNGSTSGSRAVGHGVPQGSVLGPLLFLMYINDLPNYINSSNVILFADDTTDLLRYHPSEPIRNVIVDQHSDLQNWFLANRLSLNSSKTQCLNFSLRRQGQGLCQTEMVRFLGVYLDPGLTWESHVGQLASKLSRITYLIRNLTRSVSGGTVMSAYHGYFSANMTYAILNWGHSAHAVKVFKLQRRCIRIIGGLGYRDCCRHCFPEIGVLTLPCVYILQCLNYIKQNIHQFVMRGDIHDYPTRGRNLVAPDFHRLSRTRRGTDYYCVTFYNVLPDQVRALSDKIFYGKMKLYMRRKAFYSFEEYLQNDFNDLSVQL